MSINWTAVYNLLFKIIDQPGEPYFSGPRFIRHVQELEPGFPDYGDFLKLRNDAGLSTTRKTYFRDILLGLPEPQRVALVGNILAEVGQFNGEFAEKVRGLIGDQNPGPSASIPEGVWNSERLNAMLGEMDKWISERNYERTVSIAYTCLEGFLKAFIRAKIPAETHVKEIIDLAKVVKTYIRQNNPEYPDEITALLGHIAHTVNITRDRFSESHFGGEPARWGGGLSARYGE